MHPDFQGKGLMQEAIPPILEYGFDIMKLEIIEAVPHENNAASIRILEKNNFQREKNLEGEYAHLVLFKLEKKDFKYA